MRRFAAALLLLAFMAPSAWAQASEGTIATSVEPEELVLDYSKHVGREGQDPPRQSFTVHVTGEIQCTAGIPPPLDPGIVASGQTSLRSGTPGDQVAYMEIHPTQFAAPWVHQGGGRYTIDHDEVITVYSNASAPVDNEAELQWNAGYGEPEGTTRCNPSGYAWAAQGEFHTIVIPGPGDGDPDPFPEPPGSNGTPLGAWVPFGALAVALALRRGRR